MNHPIAKELFSNLGLLLTISAIYAILPAKAFKHKSFTGFIIGCVIGLVGMGIMANSFELVPGLVFDTRTILISSTGLFFGFIPTLVAALITAAFRVYEGGVGVVMGVSTIICAAGIGLLWRITRIKKLLENKKYRVLELYGLGLSTHVGLLLCMALLPSSLAPDVLKVISLPILAIFPVGSVIMGLMLLVQYDRNETHAKLQESEERLKVTLYSVGDGVITTDDLGNITMINKVGEMITGWAAADIIGQPFKKVLKIFNEYTREPVEDPIQKVLDTGHIVGLANHSVLVRADGSEKPIADSAAPIKDENGKVEGVVLVLRDVTEERKKQQEIAYLGYHDTLTGLRNRAFFDEQLVTINSSEKLPVTVIIGDVNGLKMTNDAFGHAMGDRLLKEMANTVKAACREGDIVARWGGDEFIVLLEKADEKAAEEICKKIKAACSTVNMDCIDFSISLGYETKHKPEEDIESIIKKAEDYMYRKKSMESLSMRGNTINTILSTLHEKSPGERQHSNRVSELCRDIGTTLNMTERELTELCISGLMHDIGKIAVNESILNKKGKLTVEEYDEMKRHPEVGYRILHASSNMTYISKYVLAHHERLDGRGYPNKLSADEIPFQSKILAAADAYDAMTSDRPYRKAMPTEDAIAEMRRNIGTQFDEVVVCALIDSLREKRSQAGETPH